MGCDNKERGPFLNANYLGGLWIIVTGIILLACFFQIVRNWMAKKKTDKRKKCLSLFSMSSPSNPDLIKKRMDPYLTVNDYVQIPDRNLAHSLENELKGFFNDIFFFFFFFFFI